MLYYSIMHYDDYYTSHENYLPLQTTQLKKRDQNYHFIHNENKKRKIEFYSTSEYSTCIRDAMTGRYYKDMKLGTKAECMFFKIKIFEGPRGFTLFYNSPEEFEKHQHKIISQKIKDKWYLESNQYYKEWYNRENK